MEELYYATRNLNHNGVTYKRGDQVRFNPNETEAARTLIANGVIQRNPLPEDTVPGAPAAEPEQEPRPSVEGKPMETGEPSIDGNQDRGADNAEDITPETHSEAPQGGMRAMSPDVRADAPSAPQRGSEPLPEPDESMTRAELEEIALNEGIGEGDVTGAPNKSVLVDLIKEHRSLPADQKQPEHDPSDNL